MRFCMNSSSWLLIFLAFIHLSECELYKPEATITCSNSQKCPSEWPCCSQYGECGAGPVCITGCNPKFSFNDKSCLPMPALIQPYMLNYHSARNIHPFGNGIVGSELEKTRSAQFTKNLLNVDNELRLNDRRFINHANFLVTPNEKDAVAMLQSFDFTHSGYVEILQDTGELTLNMPKRSTGSVIASTKSMLYGKVSVKMKTSRSRGVVTALDLISSSGDEIDYEFLGGELTKVQTNYYYQGELDYEKMKKCKVSSNTDTDYHLYEIDWSRYKIDWIIDGVVVRSIMKIDTWDPILGRYKFPQTPMRVEIAIWPGGSENNAPGTIEWAGGSIDWDTASDIVNHGKFSVFIENLNMIPHDNQFLHEFDDCLRKHNSNMGSDKLSRLTYTYKPGNLEFYSEDTVNVRCDIIPYVTDYKGSGLQRISRLSNDGLYDKHSKSLYKRQMEQNPSMKSISKQIKNDDLSSEQHELSSAALSSHTHNPVKILCRHIKNILFMSR